MGEPTALPWKWHSRVEDDLQTGSIYSEERKGHAYAVAIAPRYQKTEQWTIDATLIVEAVNNHARLLTALRNVLYWNAEFRAGMPDGWEGDPLQDACEEARKVLDAIERSTNAQA